MNPTMKRDNLFLIPLIIIAFFVIVVIFRELRELLVPFAIAVLFSILFYPLVSFLRQKKVPIVFSLIVVLCLIGGAIFILGTLIYSSAIPLVQELPNYQNKFDQILNNAAGALGDILGAVGFKSGPIDTKMLFGVTTVTAEALSSTLATFLDFLGKVGLVMIFMLFMLAGTGNLNAKIQKAYSSVIANPIRAALQNIGKQVRRYLVIRILLSGLAGLLTMLITWMLGVNFALFWGFMAFLLSLIPTVGAFLAISLPFIFSLLQFDELTRPLLVLVLLITVFMINGNVVQPKLMAETLNLSPLLIIVALIFWGLMWGPWGMILAIPLTTAIKIIFENIEPLKPISIIMSAGSDQ
jgi:predicted PurR-regulated permease PerM